MVKNLPANAGDAGDLGVILGLGNGNPLQYSAWEILWTEESGGLQSMGSQSRTLLSTHIHTGICRCENNCWLYTIPSIFPIQSELLKIHQGGQASDWKKMFTKDMADKGQLSKLYKELLKSTIRKQITDFKMGKRPEQTLHQRWQTST